METKEGRVLPTERQWAWIERLLSSPYMQVDMGIDGYKVSLLTQPTRPLEFAIMVYINDCFKGEWISNDCEERRRFFRRSTVSVWSGAQRKAFKTMSKQTLRSMGVDPDEKAVAYTPYWPSFGPLWRHLLKHNRNIMLLAPGVPEGFEIGGEL